LTQTLTYNQASRRPPTVGPHAASQNAAVLNRHWWHCYLVLSNPLIKVTEERVKKATNAPCQFLTTVPVIIVQRNSK